MTYNTINEINFLASAGVGYQRIAEQLGLSANTVKSHLQCHPPCIDKMICENCGQPVPQAPGRKMKRYCDDKCRIKNTNIQL